MDMNMQTFEELQRYQLVTEFNIQSQSELTDYQVKLDNVDNPTQAQDNLIVGVNGEQLPHWNESLDFDTWVKMNIATSGKRGLLIHGNTGLSSGNSISDTFVKGDDFSDGGLDSMWDNLNSRIWTESGEILTVTNTGNPSTLKVDLPISDFIIEANIKPNTINTDKRFGIGARYAASGYGYSLIHSHSSLNPSNTKVQIQRDAFEFGTDYTLPFTVTVGTFYNAKLQIVGNTQKGKWWVKGTSEPVSWDMSQTYSVLPNNNAGLYGGQDTGNDISYDNFRVRKYAAIEPNVTINTPKNISTALKSFGRAG